VFADVSVSVRLRDPDVHFTGGVAFSQVAAAFEARCHRVPSVIGNKGSSIINGDPASLVCSLNSTNSRVIIESLNPGVGFELGDVDRLPFFQILGSREIIATLDAAFTLHESHRESSVEFRSPGPSPWEHAQKWAQDAVDRAPGAPLPAYLPVFEPEPPTDHVSYALGVVLGRLEPRGGGVLDATKGDPSEAYADVSFLDDAFLGEDRSGLLFLDGATELDDLDLPAAQPLRDAWKTHGPAIDGTNDVRGLRAWLRTSFFAIHRKMYDNRPIHWPLSSSNRTFVAWVNIHRMGAQTLPAVLARAESALLRLRGRAGDLRRDRDGADAGASKAAERLLGPIQKHLVEIEKFVADLRSLATKGPPQGVPPREVDASYAPDLDDGVMINSAALWPILEPQWKDPKKWWTELAKAEGRKDYDWSHLAARYWPDRVDQKCKKDPSLGVAHGCFWRYHPARAYAWELRLQDEIGPDFRIDEPDADACRDKFLRDEPVEAKKIRAKERKRRRKKYGDDVQIILFGAPADEADDSIGDEGPDDVADDGTDTDSGDGDPGQATPEVHVRSPVVRLVPSAQPATAPKETPREATRGPSLPALPPWDPAPLRNALNGTWAMSGSDRVANSLAVLAAVLRRVGQPAPARMVRWAAAVCLHPHLLPPLMESGWQDQWRRVVGAEADPLPAGVHRLVPGQDRAWGQALRDLRASRLLLESEAGETWAPSAELLALPRIDWADGRAAMVLSVLHRIGLDDAVNALPAEVRELYLVAA
jgi:hypothetical protein